MLNDVKYEYAHHDINILSDAFNELSDDFLFILARFWFNDVKYRRK